jgi:hypothetical protein
MRPYSRIEDVNGCNTISKLCLLGWRVRVGLWKNSREGEHSDGTNSPANALLAPTVERCIVSRVDHHVVFLELAAGHVRDGQVLDGRCIFETLEFSREHPLAG